MCLLIAIEGIDGSGKGTQAAKLHAYLLARGRKSALLSFPRYQKTQFGLKIGEFLNGKFGTLETVHPLLASLLFAGDRFESRELIEQTIASHEIVVFDRYVASNVAHQGAKSTGQERTKLIEWILHLEHTIYQLPHAHRNLFLDINVPLAQQLIAAKSKRDYTEKSADLQEADTDYLHQVRSVYLELATGPNWTTIPCESPHGLRTIDEIAADIVATVESLAGAL
ncbi:dTMP kinase [Schlesneria sp.]|uniref:dTMP kinase n=1 Tax=Schlesneria sp. TaxID=2762018 RepID=UPI002EE1AD70